MSKKYDVVATIGTYEKDGQTMYVTRNVSAIISTSKGFRMKIDASFNPAGCMKSDDGGVWLALFEPKDQRQNEVNQTNAHNRQARQGHQQNSHGASYDPDDGTPF